MSDDAESTSVKLKSKQEEVFEVEKEVACRSVTVKNMVDDTETLNAPVPLPMVDSKILIKVIEYCKYHHKAESESLPEDEKNVWDKDFVKVDDETLFNLILAANYLDIKPLLDLTCKTVADEIKGKTPEEIRVRFNIKPEFVPGGTPTAKLIERIQEFGTTPTCEISARIENIRPSSRRRGRRRGAAWSSRRWRGR